MKKYFQNITFSGSLSALSFLVVFGLLAIYLFGNFLNNDAFIRIFDRAQERGLVWYVLIFVVLCNLDHIRDIIKSAVRGKIDSIVVSDIREEIKRSIENDPDMLKKLQEAQGKKEKQSFIDKPINPNK